MEKIEKILDFIKDIGMGAGARYDVVSGFGAGFGDGDGSGEGVVYGLGNGSGPDEGDGYGGGAGSGSGYSHDDGSGYGSGYGCGCVSDYDDNYDSPCGKGSYLGGGYGDIQVIKQINGEQVFYLDKIPTIIDHIRDNVAIGRIIDEVDYMQTKCYIAKGQGECVHEKTLKEAITSLRNKIIANMDTEQRIEEFRKKFNNTSKYSGRTFFEWHNTLTGSCLAGRTSFIQSRNLSLDKKYSVKEFISICENAYGGDVIKRLKEFYK